MKKKNKGTTYLCSAVDTDAKLWEGGDVEGMKKAVVLRIACLLVGLRGGEVSRILEGILAWSVSKFDEPIIKSSSSGSMGATRVSSARFTINWYVRDCFVWPGCGGRSHL